MTPDDEMAFRTTVDLLVMLDPERFRRDAPATIEAARHLTPRPPREPVPAALSMPSGLTKRGNP